MYKISINAIKTIIENGRPTNWTKSFKNYRTIWVNNEDVNLRIEEVSIESDDKFHEKWATNHPDPNAYKNHYDVYYGSSPIKNVTLVSVDGGRGILPMPKINTNEVNWFDYKIAEIVDIGLSEYMDRSGLSVTDPSKLTPEQIKKRELLFAEVNQRAKENYNNYGL